MCLGTLTTSFAQGDSTTIINSAVDADNFNLELTLASRNVFRGVSYGESPSIMMKVGWMPCKWFEAGTYGNMTFNGTKDGYGNQVNTYFTIKPFANSKSQLKNISITSDDFFYFNADDADNNFFAWSGNKTQHFMEARVMYNGRIDLTAAYTYHANDNANVDGIYFEAGYDVSPMFYVFAGYLTDQNDLMFQNEAGFTNVGGTFTKKISVKDAGNTILKISLIGSPTYETIQEYPGVGTNPISLVASLTF